MAKDIKGVVLLGRRLLLLPEVREVSGLVLCGKLPREECRVVKVGVKCREIVEGDKVVLSSYVGQELELFGVKYKLVEESDALMVL